VHTRDQLRALLAEKSTPPGNVTLAASVDTIKATAMLKGVGIVEGLCATSPILDEKEFVTGPQSLSKYRAAFKVEPTYSGHYTYDAMYVLADAMKQADSNGTKKITQTLRPLDGYVPITGFMKWDAVGEQRYRVAGVYPAHGGHWELQLRSNRW
jgi:branched-chain amino acid transport system substrate-binding protein